MLVWAYGLWYMTYGTCKMRLLVTLRWEEDKLHRLRLVFYFLVG